MGQKRRNLLTERDSGTVGLSILYNQAKQSSKLSRVPIAVAYASQAYFSSFILSELLSRLALYLIQFKRTTCFYGSSSSWPSAVLWTIPVLVVMLHHVVSRIDALPVSLAMTGQPDNEVYEINMNMNAVRRIAVSFPTVIPPNLLFICSPFNI